MLDSISPLQAIIQASETSNHQRTILVSAMVKICFASGQDQPPERSQHDLQLAPICKHVSRPHQHPSGGCVFSTFTPIRELWCFIVCKTGHRYGEIRADLVFADTSFQSTRALIVGITQHQS